MNLQSGVQISLVVMITGLVIVFAVLVCLILVVKGFGATVRSLESKLEGTSPKGPARRETEKSLPVGKNLPAVAEGIPEEIIAVISAAAYSMCPEGQVTSIRRSVRAERSAWGMAGLVESTRPF